MATEQQTERMNFCLLKASYPKNSLIFLKITFAFPVKGDWE